MKRSLGLAALCALSLHPARAVEWDSLKPVAPFARFQKTPNGVLITCQDQSQIAIQVLASDLIRVRASFGQSLPGRDHSWAIAKTSWTVPDFKIVDGPEELLLTTQEVEIAVHHSPFLIAFRDPATHTVINADDRPISYDPKSTAIGVIKRMGFDEHFFGLGEKAAPFDKRRGRFTMWNTDAYRYTDGTDPIYQSIPFYIGWENGNAYGIFYDNSYRSSFDFGTRSEEFTVFTADGGPLNYYFFAGPSIKKILGRYTELTGRMPLPPRWALGNQQSRYTYYPAAEVMKVAETYRSHDLPLDAIHLDINYMNGYRDFTWDTQRFPNPRQMTDALSKMGVKLVTILDPGVKYQPPSPGAKDATDHPELAPQDKSYYAYNQGKANDYFLKRSNGQLYLGKVWPGDAVFIDYTKEAAAQWWGQMLRAYTDNGVSGIWTDMNEPSDFVDQTGAKQMDVISYDGGAWSPYAANRNLFALQMTRATYQGLQCLRPNERPFVITRAGFAGIQRYATMWTGDNSSTWDSLALSLPMFQSLGLSGESFVGADVGGFAGRSNGQLLTRWYEVGFLTPFLRNHAEMGTYDHEPWRFGSDYETIIRKYLKLRYRLLPFLYSTLEEAHRTGVPILRPLLLNYQNDANTLNIDDEVMVGSDLLLAPVLKPDQESRSVYLPAGTWVDYWTGERCPGGRTIRVSAPLETVPLFVRAGAVLPMGPEMNSTGEKPLDPVTFEIYPDDQEQAAGSLYEDDGVSPAYQTGVLQRTTVALHAANGNLEIDVHHPERGYQAPKREMVFVVRSAREQGQRCSLDGNFGACQLGRHGNDVQLRVTDDAQDHRIAIQR